MENEEFIDETEPDEIIICEDDAEELLKKYESAEKRRTDDVPAMQAVMCILLAAVIFGINAFYPEIGGGLFKIIKKLSMGSTETFPNPIDMLLKNL